MLTVDVFKTFINATLLDQFPDVETKVPSEDGTTEEVKTEPNSTLKSAVQVANQSYNSLTSNLPSRAVVRFDSLTYQVKSALCHVYEFVLQDHATLHALSLQTMSLSENQVFDNYYKLLEAEREELADMRKELLDEIADKEEDSKNLGVMLYHRYPQRPFSNGRPRGRW